MRSRSWFFALALLGVLALPFASKGDGFSGGGFTSPMTTTGDVIVGGAAGSPARLGVGFASQVLTVSGGAPAWVTPTATIAKYNCEAYFAANFALTSGTDNAVTWDTETYDNGGLHDTSTNKDRFTAPATGMYHFDCYFFVAANGTGARNVQAFKNTSVNSFLYDSTQNDITSVGREMELHFSVQLAANDYIKFTAYQNSGGNLNLLGGATDGSGSNASLSSRVQMFLVAGQ